MSYNGTVRCRECYGSGHNRRTCPTRTERMLRSAKRDADRGLTDSYSIRQYEKRVGHKLDGSPLPKSAKAARNPRRCTYCGARGHNRRTCKTLVANKATYIEKNLAFRKRALEGIKASGLGVGALLKTERWGDTYCWMVTQINWKGIEESRFGNLDLILGQNIRETDRYNKTQWLGFPPLVDDAGVGLNEVRDSVNTVIGPVAVRGIPEDFLTEEALEPNLAAHFCKDTKSVDYWDNYHAS